MPSWQDDFLAALQERDRREKSQAAALDMYSKLADRVAALQNSPAADTAPSQDVAAPAPRDRKTGKDGNARQSPAPGETLASVRQDLAEAQRSRGLMESKLQSITDELQKLKIQSSLDANRIRELTKDRNTLTIRVRDRDEEIRGKTKLLEDLHDETVAMTLQINMADERSEKFEKENKELVDRWMKKMALEADAMNDKSKFS